MARKSPKAAFGVSKFAPVHRRGCPSASVLLAGLLLGCGTGGPGAVDSSDAGSTTQATDAVNDCNGRGQALDHLVATRADGDDAGLTIRLQLLEATPNPAVVGNNSWLFALTVDGQPAEGLAEAMTVTPFMPDHGHGTPTAVGVTEEQPGEYRFEPVYTRMAGYWEQTVDIESDELQAQLVFGVCVE